MSQDSYNFRYASQRERCHKDIVKEWEKLYDKLGPDVTGLRFVLDIESPKEFSEVKVSPSGDVAGEGSMVGYRTFKDLRTLKLFLTGQQYRGTQLAIGNYDTQVRIVSYRMRGSRITGERVYATFNISRT